MLHLNLAHLAQVENAKCRVSASEKTERALLNQRATKSKSQSAAHKSCIIICLFGLLISWAPKPRSQFPVTQWGTVEVVAEELTSKYNSQKV